MRLTEGRLEPPGTLLGTLRYLGPGLLVAATVVGAGELIATTRTGARAGISLLWLIVLGCLIKVFVQVELGRYAIASGETTLRALNRVPGPRWRANWVVWLWFALMPATFVIMGGVIGGVGQALAIAVPVTGDYARALSLSNPDAIIGGTFDDRFWALTVAGLTAVVLAVGRYSLIERIGTSLVMLFTLVTVANMVLLQASPYRVPADAIIDGLLFQMPALPDAWLIALATFGIIGVGAVDLIAYPYWCLEKGYARFAGRNDGTAGWLARARGWVRVMQLDVCVSLAVCTLSTVAFYFIGAAVLHRLDAEPDGMRMISTLIAAYEPVFGDYGKWLLLAGALAVLYSSFLIATAAAARLLTDGLTILGVFRERDGAGTDIIVRRLSFILALVAAAFFTAGWNPAVLIIIGGLAQTVLLPVVGFGAVWLRYRVTDPQLVPGAWWTAALVLSCISFVVIGVFGWYRYLS